MYLPRRIIEMTLKNCWMLLWMLFIAGVLDARSTENRNVSEKFLDISQLEIVF